jgi:hypothetical protein
MIAAYLKRLSDALEFDPALASHVVAETREHLVDAADQESMLGQKNLWATFGSGSFPRA